MQAQHAGRRVVDMQLHLVDRTLIRRREVGGHGLPGRLRLAQQLVGHLPAEDRIPACEMATLNQKGAALFALHPCRVQPGGDSGQGQHGTGRDQSYLTVPAERRASVLKTLLHASALRP